MVTDVNPKGIIIGTNQTLFVGSSGEDTNDQYLQRIAYNTRRKLLNQSGIYFHTWDEVVAVIDKNLQSPPA